MEKRKKGLASIMQEPAPAYNATPSAHSIPAAYRRMITDEHQIIEYASKGVSAKAITDFNRISGRAKEEIADWLYITPKTIRNYEAASRKLPVLQSEILLKLYALYNKGIAVFGDTASFNAWMKLPAQGLYQKVPESLLTTSTGMGLIQDELTRIEFGEFA